MSTPITEASNRITEEIDISSPLEIVSLLEKCDQEIFNGYEDYKSMFSEEIIKRIDDVSGHVIEMLQEDGGGIVVFSGCGTSGRLGFMVARTFNELQRRQKRPEIFRYLIAGGDKALFTSQEAPEDDPQAGIEALKKVSEGKTRVLYIGITCGLSAPYVAGQLEYCMDNPKFVPVLLGFNPENLARNTAIENWDKTFLQVINRLKIFPSKSRSGYIINPVVGPDPITGSSRMKCGTATKILLETICLTGLCDMYYPEENLQPSDLMRCYNIVNKAVYKVKQDLSRIVESAGQSLRAGGKIYYMGSDSLALMGLIDASECPPTYGATLDDIRGFVDNGYKTLQNIEGDLSKLGKHFRISNDNFCTDISLMDRDILIVINSEVPSVISAECTKKGCRKILLTFGKAKSKGFLHSLHIDVPTVELDELIGSDTRTTANQMFREIAVKCCLNAISTGAHIMKGKIYKNFMIDVKVSNNKLFHRAVGILERLGHLSKVKATEYLLRSIYDTDEVSENITSRPITQHIITATDKEKVVPVALVAAVTDTTISDAKLALSKQSVIRTAIAHALKDVSQDLA
ncbi:glucokinase regulatory protein-like [Mercenaria mercenaria]|uniref:glucokinase regulatory protein-like n=1 Tax=Mercenaria mercenaria TaxID=6596 RepID=UPI00234E8EB9|nr:glucokinase regulatory protein-like [Mercenaria mercenaria]XP_053394874.1 glucokinase regulatory protein-like [Mercenaria mercenaria]